MPSDLRLVIALAALTCISVFLPPLDNTAIRTILGIPLVLFLPGYSLIAALFPGKNDLDPIERIALSFGLSIAIVPLIGLVLNFTPWGIRLVPIMISLTFFIIVMVFVAQFRRLGLSQNMRFEVKFKEMGNSLKTELFAKPENRIDKLLTIVLLISILASVIMLVYVIVTPKQGEKFTEFYLLGPDGKAQGYPTNLTTGKTGSVIVGIVNHEYQPVNYTLQVNINEEKLNEQQVQTLHNQTLEQQVNFTPVHAGTGLKLQFLLYRNDNITQPYRDTHLWVNVKN
ncbi:MAG: DUF1616 domain-containing protein [Candidatus Methanoperedens sp.]|nr:DUF1616 domain-containing protein [Candidatus Methanoperedens sp.]